MKHPCQIYFFADCLIVNEVALDAIEPPNMDDFFVPFLFFFVLFCSLLLFVVSVVASNKWTFNCGVANVLWWFIVADAGCGIELRYRLL